VCRCKQRERSPSRYQQPASSVREGDEASVPESSVERTDEAFTGRRNPRRAARNRAHRGGSNPHAALWAAPMPPHELANIGCLASMPDRIRDTYQKKMYDTLHVELYDDRAGYLTALHPLAFAAKANSEDTPRFAEAMNGPDREGFIEAMKAEIEQLNKMDAWVVVDRPSSIDPATGETINILDSTAV